MMYVISTFLPYFSFFISIFFENFKSGRNFSKFTAGLCYRLLPVSVKIGGNRRLPIVLPPITGIGKNRPIGKENTASAWPFGSSLA